jgi:hypothetical protein
MTPTVQSAASASRRQLSFRRINGTGHWVGAIVWVLGPSSGIDSSIWGARRCRRDLSERYLQNAYLSDVIATIWIRLRGQHSRSTPERRIGSLLRKNITDVNPPHFQESYHLSLKYLLTMKFSIAISALLVGSAAAWSSPMTMKTGEK